MTKHVDFEDLVFDRTSNTWVIDGESIAKKKGKCCAELLPGYLYTIWSQLDEGEGLSFHVMIEKPEGVDGE